MDDVFDVRFYLQDLLEGGLSKRGSRSYNIILQHLNADQITLYYLWFFYVVENEMEWIEMYNIFFAFHLFKNQVKMKDFHVYLVILERIQSKIYI